MKTKILTLLTAVVAASAVLFFVSKKTPSPVKSASYKERESKEEKTRFYIERMKYEYDMIKDPVTGKVPKNIYELERDFALTIPVRGNGSLYARQLLNNNYIPAGPNNIGGRTRAVRYDIRYNGSTNRVIIAGCVSGGIYRSTDGGNTWALVTPLGDIHSFTALAQDPRPGFQDTWYAGGGEYIGNTASEIGATYLGYGIWKSTNNGASWTKLPLNTITDINGSIISPGTYESFDHPFDLVHRIQVHPATGHVYIAGHRRLIRSTDGGSTYQVVFGGTVGVTSTAGQMDVDISSAGQILLGVNGGYPELNLRGVWVSNTGDRNTYTRIAGGQTLSVDSAAGWRGNSYDIIAAPATYASKRIVLRYAPSNPNVAYVFYENGLSSDPPTPQPEADLFRLDISGSSYTWSNRSANMPNFAGNDLAGSDPLTVQNGYDMEVAVKPDNPNVVFIGGTNLYRSTDGFATTANTAWIGGYNNNFTYAQYPNSHADIHRVTFNPSNPNVAICANDGGVQETTDIMATAVGWRMLPNYQTLQCYNVAIDPMPGRNNFASGSQDNGVRFRDATGILGTPPADSNNHRLLFSADGAYVSIANEANGVQYIFESIQFGRLYRARLTSPFPGGQEITPAGLTPANPGSTGNEFGEFVTNFRLVTESTEDIYYINFNRLFRAVNASAVTSGSWTELSGVSQAVNPTNPTSGRNVAIRGLGFSRGPYQTTHALYLGTTNGKIFRLDNPRNATPNQAPVDITPAGLIGNVQDIAVNPNNDNEIMAVVSNYGATNTSGQLTNITNIWWTNNAKSANPTWVQAEGTLAGGFISARSCVIAVKKDATGNNVTEYYVGTHAGLYGATNIGSGNATWTREGEQILNLAVVSSMAYRPADNVLLVGTHGNGIFYTNLGTPNFGSGGGSPTPDNVFVRAVIPTITTNRINFTVGNMTGVSKINVQLVDMSGRVVYQQTSSYQNGFIDTYRFASGVYILRIQSEDGRQRFTQKILKR